MDYKLNPGEVSPTSACEAVFPAGCFLLGVVDGQEAYSKEIRVPFSPSGLTGFGAHGFYELETDPVVENVGISSVFARGDGSHCFMRAVGEDLYLETFDENDPSKVDEAMIEGVVLPTYPLTSTVLRCAMLPEDRCLVTASFEYGEASGLARAYLVDLGTRQVIHEASLSRYDRAVPRHGRWGTRPLWARMRISSGLGTAMCWHRRSRAPMRARKPPVTRLRMTKACFGRGRGMSTMRATG